MTRRPRGPESLVATYEFHIVCRMHGYHAGPARFDDPLDALRAVDGLSVTDCGEDAVLVITEPGRSRRHVASEPGAMRALLEAAAQGRHGEPELEPLRRYATKVDDQAAALTATLDRLVEHGITHDDDCPTCRLVRSELHRLRRGYPQAPQALAGVRIHERALFEDLEEVARALISRMPGPHERMYALLGSASLAHAERRYGDARSALGELHAVALHGGEK